MKPTTLAIKKIQGLHSKLLALTVICEAPLVGQVSVEISRELAAIQKLLRRRSNKAVVV